MDGDTDVEVAVSADAEVLGVVGERVDLGAASGGAGTGDSVSV